MVTEQIHVEILNSKTLNSKRYLKLWNRNEYSFNDDDNINSLRYSHSQFKCKKKFSVLSWPMKGSSSFLQKTLAKRRERIKKPLLLTAKHLDNHLHWKITQFTVCTVLVQRDATLQR